MKKKITALMLTAGLALSLSACGNKTPNTTPTRHPTPPPNIKMGGG